MHKLGANWQAKIICLLVAIILWFIVINEQNPTSEGSYTIPVVVENLDSQYIASNVPQTVYVRLSAPRNTIVNIGAGDIKAYVDLSDVSEGEMNVPIHLELPSGTELKKQSVTTANVRIDIYAVQEFKVTPKLSGNLDDDITVESTKIVPEKVIVSGARRLIKQVSRAVIEIPVAGKKNDFTYMAPVKLQQSDGTPVEGLEITPWQSNVKVSLVHNAVVKKVPVNLITYGNVAPGYRLKQVVLTPDEAEVRGSADTISNLNRLNLMPISIDGLEATKEWRVAIPPVEGVTMNPDSVQIKVEIEKR